MTSLNVPTLGGGSRQYMAHASPYFTLSQLYTPKNLQDLFRWCEFLFYKSPHILATLRKFGEYPITTLTYDTENTALKEKYRHLHDDIIHTREVLLKATLDKYLYGNVFVSMYQPFLRFLQCPNCKSLHNIKHTTYKYHPKKVLFTFTCQSCGVKGTVDEKGVKDRKLMLPRKINFVTWDPKQMSISHNRVSGESVYYYKIHPEDIKRINAGDRTFIDAMPIGFLKAASEKKSFRFAPGMVFHMKIPGPSGIPASWGYPPILSVLDLFHYTQILRKANEAIASDHLIPGRVIYPAQNSGNGDPLQMINLNKWRQEMNEFLTRKRIDPLQVHFSPVPVGVTQLGGQGRALLTLGEIQEADKSIVTALGIPLEFLYGGLTQSGMEATLRLIENQLETHINDLRDMLQWMTGMCARFLGWEKIKVDMVKFKLVDDRTRQQALIQLWLQGASGQGPRMVSNTTVAELLEVDEQKEQGRIKQETLSSMRMQKELSIEQQKIESDIAHQAQQAAIAGGGGYDQQRVIGQADQIVNQLMAMDEGMRKSQLHELQVSDYVLYAVVVQRLEQARLMRQNVAEEQLGG